ncbi:MAG: hypothetical protein ACRDRA_17005 [Pseudonocardiaceae bacterium]
MSQPEQPLPGDPSEPVHGAGSGEPGGTSSTPPLNQTGFGRSLAATLIWPGVIVAFAPPLYPPDPATFYSKVFIGTILGAFLLWRIARKSSWSFLLLVLVALPCFVVGFGFAGVGISQR